MTAGKRTGILAFILPLLILSLIAAIVTWPQLLHFATHVGAHDDPLFSMWRLAWVAHALATDPRRMFDANIFHPATNTLAYSDAMVLQGTLGAPLFWLNLHPVLIHNLLLMGAIVGSGLAMFVLARDLVGDDNAALVSAAIFTATPYRIEHFMHLELQWAMWMPLAFWAIHRSISRRSWQYGLLAGLFWWLQILSSVYYGVFLAMAIAALLLLLIVAQPRDTARALPSIGVGLAIAAALALPYGLPYLETARTLGERETAEVTTYSAKLASYFASPPQSLLWGWTANRFGGPEQSLFPGAIAVILAAIGALSRPRRLPLIYAGLALIAMLLSLGLNGLVYSWLFNHVDALHGFRSPAR